jgi:hypothetical protein
MKRKIKITFVLLAISCWLFFWSAPARAELVTIQITAEVDHVDDPFDYLKGQIKVGDIVSGRYVYDDSSPDLNTWPNQGHYEYSTIPYGIFLEVNGFEFQTDPASVDFVFDVGNDYADSDDYFLLSGNNVPLPDGTYVGGIYWHLSDSTETALSSDKLPTTAPVLDDWGFNFMSFGAGTRARSFAIASHVVSTELVPEPATIFLLGMGGLLLRKRK